MTQTSTATKLSPTDRRLAFIKSVTAPVGDRDIARFQLKTAGLDQALVPAMTVEELTKVAERMDTEGSPLGRTERWVNACAFAITEIDCAKTAGTLDASHAHWAVVQGSVWMGYAA